MNSGQAFCFCRRVGFVCRSKSKCAICGLAVEFQNFCPLIQKIKTHSGWQRVSCYWSVSFVFHSKFNIPFLLSICCVVVFSPLVNNGRNYMQLPTAGGFPVEPHRWCCGLHRLLSARKRQLTYSFCYGQLFFLFIFGSLRFFQFYSSN